VTIEGAAITIEELQSPGTEPKPSSVSFFLETEKGLVNMSPTLFVIRYCKYLLLAIPQLYTKFTYLYIHNHSQLKLTKTRV